MNVKNMSSSRGTAIPNQFVIRAIFKVTALLLLKYTRTEKQNWTAVHGIIR